jgi:hypothetical protein
MNYDDWKLRSPEDQDEIDHRGEAEADWEAENADNKRDDLRDQAEEDKEAEERD